MSLLRKKREDIIDFFPGTPRPIQMEALTQIQENWGKADVFVINLPVGAGKSRIALTAARWAHSLHSSSSSIITPTNLLVEQYRKDFPRLFSLSKKESYTCLRSTDSLRVSCKETHAQKGSHCSGCPYTQLIRQAHAVPFGIYNSHIYLSHRLFKPLLVADEAHTLINVLKDRASRVLWTHDYGFPGWVTNHGKLLSWLESNPYLEEDPKLGLLYQELTNGKPRYVITRGSELYRGEEKDCIKMSPIDVRDQPPIFWPAKVKKILLLSATIGKKDIEQLGLDKRRVMVINASSPVEASRRPTIYLGTCNLSFKHQEESLPRLAELIRELLGKHSEKGLIHTTYSLAARLRVLLHSESRLRWHTKENSREQYEAFKQESPESGAVLVASGMYEGIDLPYDAARWQIISKVPYPSLAEPAIKYLAEQDPEWYSWETSKTLLQASGRVVRASDDWGITYIVDSSFSSLYKKANHLFPTWWKDSLVGID